MKRQLLFLITGFLFSLNSQGMVPAFGCHTDSINDGPYFVKVYENIIARWVENNQFRERYISPVRFPEIKKNFNLSFNYEDLENVFLLKPDYKQNYTNVDSIGIITDVHGEYHTYINLLRANGIIDKNLQWNFGTGHLVVIGDVFDRGQMVTEILWHLFGLEKEAERSGGKVHLLLGNHELMVLSNELDYINEKYNKVELISGIKYSDLFSGNSVLGIWLRSKPVMITINKILFVHAGISMEMIYRNLGISRVNRLFSTRILANERTAVSKNEELAFLNGNNGPLWYRGYFEDSSFCESKIDSILNFYRTDHIVVGHTPAKRARSFFNNKILGIDTGIMYELPGEILIYKNGSFFKCCPRGSRTKL